MKHPLNLFEMDTILTSHGHHNPASFGTYPRILGHYVREMRLLTLEDAVHKATGMAAKRMRLGARGLVRAGYAADLVIFNPETIGCARRLKNANAGAGRNRARDGQRNRGRRERQMVRRRRDGGRVDRARNLTLRAWSR